MRKLKEKIEKKEIIKERNNKRKKKNNKRKKEKIFKISPNNYFYMVTLMVHKNSQS